MRTATPTAGPARLPGAVYALGATSLLNDAASEMIYPLLPVFLASVLGAGAATLGLIEGAADATASLLKLFSGRWSDRTGRRKPFVLAGYLLASAARPFIALAGSAAAVLCVRVVDRFGKGLRSSPRDALLSEVASPEMHGRAFGVHEAMDHAGAVVGPVVAWALLEHGLSMRAVFALSVVPAVLACALVAFAVRERGREARSAPPAAPVPAARLPRALRLYLVAVVLFTLGNSSDAFLLLRAHDAGLPLGAAPLLWAMHHVVKSAASAPGGVLADRFGRRRALGLAWLGYAAIYAGFAATASALGIVVLFIVYGLHFALAGGAQKALVAELAPPSARGRAFGLYHAAVGIGALPASALFGLVYQRLGAPSAFLMGALLALAAALVLPFSRQDRS